jgi:multiple sugar transport system ATP-binding protein
VPLEPTRRPAQPTGDRVIVGIRPQTFEDAAFAEGGLPQFDVEVAVLEELGSAAHVIFPLNAPPVDAVEVRAAREGDEDVLAADAWLLFNARVDPRTHAQRGAPLRLAHDPARRHFFDPATGASL